MSGQLDESYAVQTRNLRRVNGGAGRVSRIRAMKLLTTWQRGASLKLMALLPCCVTPKSDDHPWAGARTPNGITRWQDTAFVLWHHSLLQEDRFGPTSHTLSTFTMCCPPGSSSFLLPACPLTLHHRRYPGRFWQRHARLPGSALSLPDRSQRCCC